MKAVCTGSRHRQRGLSLVELIVAMVLGLLVVGGVLLAYLGSGVSSRQLRALAEMTQDAQMALSLMGRDIQMAGFVEPASVTGGATPTVTPRLAFRPVFGCDGEFADPNAGFQVSTCSATATAATTAKHSTLEVNYQLSRQANVTNSSGEPVDCKGEAAQTQAFLSGTQTTTLPFVSNRYYVGAPAGITVTESVSALYCASQTSNPAPLVDKVVQLRVFYGVSPNWSATDPSTWRPQRYVRAGDVGSAEWPGNIVAVRLCVVIRSAEPVLRPEDPTGFLDCDQTVDDTRLDRHMYRAFHSTVAIRNKVNR